MNPKKGLKSRQEETSVRRIAKEENLEDFSIRDLKWSNPTGHLVKVVKQPTDVKYDSNTKASKI